MDTATNTTNTQPIPIIANIHTLMSSSSEIMHIILALNILNTLLIVTEINMLLLRLMLGYSTVSSGRWVLTFSEDQNRMEYTKGGHISNCAPRPVYQVKYLLFIFALLLIWLCVFLLHYLGDPKITRIFFWRGEGHYFRLLPIGACTWLLSASVGQAASLRKGI
jgi:hypothetical protein